MQPEPGGDTERSSRWWAVISLRESSERQTRASSRSSNAVNVSGDGLGVQKTKSPVTTPSPPRGRHNPTARPAPPGFHGDGNLATQPGLQRNPRSLFISVRSPSFSKAPILICWTFKNVLLQDIQYMLQLLVRTEHNINECFYFISIEGPGLDFFDKVAISYFKLGNSLWLT